MTRLLIQLKNRQFACYDLKEGVTSIGRHPDNTVVLDDDSVSIYHAQIIVHGGRHILRDLLSTNGITVNGNPTGEATIKAGDLLTFGAVTCSLQELPHIATPGPTAPKTASRKTSAVSSPPPSPAPAPSSVHVVECDACGQKNRVRFVAANVINRCGACRAILQTPHAAGLASVFHGMRQWRISRQAIVPILIFLGFAITIEMVDPVLWRRKKSEDIPAPSSFLPETDLPDFKHVEPLTMPTIPHIDVKARTPAARPADVVDPELPLPRSGETQIFTSEAPLAPFEIKSSPGANYFLKLVTAYGRRDVMTIFVRGGETVEVHVPLGTYEVKYATGDRWHGYHSLFGPSTAYSKASTVFSFSKSATQITGYTITLYKVPNGNLHTEPISAHDFF